MLVTPWGALLPDSLSVASSLGGYFALAAGIFCKAECPGFAHYEPHLIRSDNYYVVGAGKFFYYVLTIFLTLNLMTCAPLLHFKATLQIPTSSEHTIDAPTDAISSESCTLVRMV